MFSLISAFFPLPAIMARWTAQDFIQEMASIERLVALRPGADLEPKIVGQLQDRMVHHPSWTAEQLCSMIEAVNASKLSASSMESLLKALDDAAGPTLSCQSQVHLTSKPQSLVQIFNYLSQRDWARLESCSSWDATVVVSERLKRCGLTSLKERNKEVGHSDHRPSPDPAVECVAKLRRHLPFSRAAPQGLPEHPGEKQGQRCHPPGLGCQLHGGRVRQKRPACAEGLGRSRSRVQHETPVRSTSRLLSWNQKKNPKNKNSMSDGDNDPVHQLLQKFLLKTVGTLDSGSSAGQAGGTFPESRAAAPHCTTASLLSQQQPHSSAQAVSPLLFEATRPVPAAEPAVQQPPAQGQRPSSPWRQQTSNPQIRRRKVRTSSSQLLLGPWQSGKLGPSERQARQNKKLQEACSSCSV